MKKLLGKQYATGLCHGDRRGSEVATKEAAELALANLQSICERGDLPLIECATLNQLECARHHCRAPVPCVEIGGTFRSTAQAWTKTRVPRGGGGRHKATILKFRWPGGADRTAINACRLHTSEESPVVTNVTRANHPITYRGIKPHPLTVSHASDAVWRFSDLVADCRSVTAQREIAIALDHQVDRAMRPAKDERRALNFLELC